MIFEELRTLSITGSVRASEPPHRNRVTGGIFLISRLSSLKSMVPGSSQLRSNATLRRLTWTRNVGDSVGEGVEVVEVNGGRVRNDTASGDGQPAQLLPNSSAHLGIVFCIILRLCCR